MSQTCQTRTLTNVIQSLRERRDIRERRKCYPGCRLIVVGASALRSPPFDRTIGCCTPPLQELHIVAGANNFPSKKSKINRWIVRR
jgi:hypothetical protein